MVNTVKLVERKRIWFLISALLLIPGIVSLIAWQLKLGIDFKGGSLTELSYPAANQAEQGREAIQQIYEAAGIKDLRIQTDTQTEGENTRYFVRTQNISDAQHKDIVRRLGEHKPAIEEIRFETTDPQVGAEVTRRAILAIVIASLAIILYIAFSFRGVPRPTSSWQMGTLAVVALLHDVLFIVGFYSLMGHLQGWEVNAEFVTAALTVMGFSVHDTIVVFDRLRENLKKFPSQSFREVANMSIAQTIARSLNTSITVIFVLLAVVLLGGANMRPFALTLLVGIAVGTYSSIFVATPLLDWWQNTPLKRFRLRLEPRIPKHVLPLRLSQRGARTKTA